MTKIISQQLVDHAAGLLDDKNNFKVYFQFNSYIPNKFTCTRNYLINLTTVI